jgi:hypothetical protein
MTKMKRAWFVLPALCLLAFLRRPEGFASPQLWAEDAAIFLPEFYAEGWSSLANPYAGYWHLLPRIVAGLSTLFPLAWAGVVFFFSAVAVFVGSAWLLTRLGWSRAQTLLLACIPFLMPSNGEIFFNITNSQWILALGGFALILRPSGALWESVYLGIASVTGLNALFWVPVLVAQKAIFRERVSPKVFLPIVAGALLQAFVLISGSHTTLAEKIPWGRWVAMIELIGGRFVKLLLTGESPANFFWFLCFIGILFAALRFAKQSEPEKRRRIILLLLFGAISYLAAAWRLQKGILDVSPVGIGGRYFFVPFACLGIVWGLALFDRRVRAATKLVLLVLAGFVVRNSLHHWGAEQWKLPSWRQEVQAFCSGTSDALRFNPERPEFRFQPPRNSACR